MRVFASVLLVVIAGSLGTAQGGSDRWVEHSYVYATVPNGGAVTVRAYIIVQADDALERLGFRRVPRPAFSSGVERDLASFKAGDLAEATIAPGSWPGCIVFSATNYDEHVAGLVEAAKAAIEARFRKSFGTSVMFYTDATCAHAL